MTTTPQHLLISFKNGTIGYMDGPVSEAKPLEQFEAEIQQRCEAIGMEGSLVNTQTYKVVGEVAYKGGSYVYERSEPALTTKPRAPKLGR